MVAVLVRTILCLLIATTSAKKSKPLDTVIDELSSIARVTNGIAIEAGMVADKRKMEEVVAEFMGLRSADVIGKMKQMKVTDVVGKLAELKPLVEKVAKLTVNTSDIQKSFEALEEMKKNADVLGKQVSDPGGDLKSEIEKVVEDIIFSKYLNVKTFIDVVETLKNIKRTDVNTISPQDTLNNLKISSERVVERLGDLKDFNKNLEIVWKLENTSERLSNVSKFAVLSEQFTTNFPTLSSMETILADLKNGISNLKAVAEQQKSMPAVVTSLEDMSAVAVELSNASPSVRLTAGLAGGVGDLKLMFEDLKGDRMRKMIAGGKETTELAEKMADVSDLHAKLEGLDGTWKQFDRQKYVGALKKVPLLLSDAMNSSQFVPDMDSTVTSLGSLRKCFTDLKMPPQPPDYKQVRDILDYGRNLSTQITQYKEFMGSRMNTFVDTQKWMKNLVGLLDDTKVVALDVWKKINENHETDKLISSLSTLHKDFQQFDSENPFETIGKMKAADWSVTQFLLKSLDDTNLLSMINCLGSVSYQSKDILSVINFRGSVNAMKSEGQSFTETNEFLSQMSKVQQGLMQVEGAGKQSKRGRRRRDVGAKSVGSLKNAEEVSVDLGRGVQVLRQLSRIVDEEKSVMVAADADDVFKKTIDAIRGSQSVWTDENRDSLKKVVSDVNKLNDAVANMTRDTMSALWLVFDAARQVPQVQIDAKVFGDPIATGLSSSADPKMQAAAGDFKVLATLDLNFVQHRHRLKAATLTLVSLRQFFDDFFGLTPDVSVVAPIIQTITSRRDSKGSNGFPLFFSTMIIMIVISIIAAVLTWVHRLDYRLLKLYLKQRELYGRRDEIWFFETLYPDNTYNENCLYLEANPGSIRVFIEFGVFLDSYYRGYTPLHCAVGNAHPDMVEMLIRGGADRSLRSIERLTAEETAKKRLKSEEYKEKHEGYLKVLALFEKYANKTFKCKVRMPLPVKDFCIKIDCATNKEEFEKKFAPVMWDDKEPVLVTHFVVDTDKDKVFDINQSWKLEYVFRPTIIVDFFWLAACLEDEKNLERAYDYRIKKVRFNGKVYETVDEWQKMANRRTIKYLYHVEVTYWNPENIKHDEGKKSVELVASKYGTFFEDLESLVSGSASRNSPAPFWFPDKPKQWIVYKDGTKEALERRLKELVAIYPNDSGVRFELMSVTEFFELLLSLEPFGGKMPKVKEEKKKKEEKKEEKKKDEKKEEKKE